MRKEWKIFELLTHEKKKKIKKNIVILCYVYSFVYNYRFLITNNQFRIKTWKWKINDMIWFEMIWYEVIWSE